MLPLVPVMWLGRKLAAAANRLRGGRQKTGLQLAVGELNPAGGFNAVMGGLLALEATFLRRGFRLPLGTSLLAFATPSTHCPRSTPPCPIFARS